jgi:hypothetical protein
MELGMAIGTCAECQWCNRLVGKKPDGTSVTTFYCRKRPPVASGNVIATSGAFAVTQGLWPAVDPKSDGCAEFRESPIM